MQQTIPPNDAYISSHVGPTPSTGPFQVDFPFFSLNDVAVVRQGDGNPFQEVLTRGSDYELVGVATEDGSFSSGTVTLSLPIINTTLIRFRTTPVERLSNFPLQGFFSRLALNAELNKITVWMQELHAMLGATSEASQAHAPIASPEFIGNPRGPTPLFGDNDTSLATTAFVQAALAAVGASIPSGVIADYGGMSAPPGWLLCQAQILSRAAYPGLFAAIGTSFNIGGELATDFRLPDVRGRVVAGPDFGGSGRLTAAGAGFDGQAVGAAGGAQTHVLVAGETPAHTHSLPNHSHYPPGNAGAYMSLNTGDLLAQFAHGSGSNLFYAGGSGDIATPGALVSGSIGSGGQHQNTQPTIILNKIIKT